MWVLTGGDDQVHLWGQVLQQEGQGFVYRSGIHNVIVVQDENEVVLDGGYLVEQGREDRLGGRWLWGLERAQDPFSDIRLYRLQSGDEVGQEACGVTVPFVQRKPGGRTPKTGEPLA